MKSRTAITAAILVAAAPAFAQDQASDAQTAQFATANGQLVVHSGMGPATPAAPAPSFDQLANGKGAITPAAAEAYPLLANDFSYADSNHDGRISKAEYARWLKKN